MRYPTVLEIKRSENQQLVLEPDFLSNSTVFGCLSWERGLELMNFGQSENLDLAFNALIDFLFPILIGFSDQAEYRLFFGAFWTPMERCFISKMIDSFNGNCGTSHSVHFFDEIETSPLNPFRLISNLRDLEATDRHMVRNAITKFFEGN
ncbi:unnamed protein product [Ambrosiozyma monospora]|nr:unnamed protein product [Ambrosiozyma monospora]